MSYENKQCSSIRKVAGRRDGENKRRTVPAVHRGSLPRCQKSEHVTRVAISGKTAWLLKMVSMCLLFRKRRRKLTALAVCLLDQAVMSFPCMSDN